MINIANETTVAQNLWMLVQPPYLLFIGDVPDVLSAKTAFGVVSWRPKWCLGQFRYSNEAIDIGLKDLTLEEAREMGAKTLIIGVANRGGVMSARWRETIIQALQLGYDVASGLHDRLNHDRELAELAQKYSCQLLDVRYPDKTSSVGTGAPRSGRRLLAVGTDCSSGKMFTTLSLERAMRQRGVNAEFVATGQTGIFIAGRGISVDAVIADFISGAVENLAPAHEDPDHWYLIEGQGSLFHPSYAGVSLGLLHGAQADTLILCHDSARKMVRNLQGYPLPGIKECIEFNEQCARLTCPEAKVKAISLNTSQLTEQEALKLIAQLEDKHGMPVTDAWRFGCDNIVDAIL